MNFYGHAQLAAGLDDDPAYALGSMLPDFEGMSRSRAVEVRHAAVRRGIALHHATDDAFHGSPEFVQLTAEALARLTREDVGRGAARACAHVGTELLLDAYLLGTLGPNPLYLEALAIAEPDRVGADLRFADAGERFEQLRRRLHAFGTPHAYSDPDFVTQRLAAALSSRPRLALRTSDEPAVGRWLRAFRIEVHRVAPALVARVERAIAPASEGTRPRA